MRDAANAARGWSSSAVSEAGPGRQTSTDQRLEDLAEPLRGVGVAQVLSQHPPLAPGIHDDGLADPQGCSTGMSTSSPPVVTSKAHVASRSTTKTWVVLTVLASVRRPSRITNPSRSTSQCPTHPSGSVARTISRKPRVSKSQRAAAGTSSYNKQGTTDG